MEWWYGEEATEEMTVKPYGEKNQPSGHECSQNWGGDQRGVTED